MIALSKMTMDAGLRLPLPIAASHILNAFNLAPLQLSANSWLQAVCTFTLYGGFRLYRLPMPMEMLFLFKLATQRGTEGVYHIQGRWGKVILGVLNKAPNDPRNGSGLEGLGGRPRVAFRPPSWISLLGFGPRSRRKIPSAAELDFDFSVVRDRIKKLPDDQIGARLLNNHARRLAARVFHFPRHLRVPEVYFPHLRTPSDLEMTKRNLGLLGRFKAGRTDRVLETNRVLIARNAPDVRTSIVRPPEDRRFREEEQLEGRKRRREGDPLVRATSSSLTNEEPIAAVPLTERRAPADPTFLSAAR
ncbi:hypothetical protein OROGR_023267 [Orobanche gracilis]